MTWLLAAAAGLVAYVFAGYPAAAAIRARVRPQPLREDPAYAPAVSLIVVAYDEEAVILERLANARALDYPSELLELIVAADGSQDATAALAASVPGVTVVYRPERRGKLAAMVRAAEVARGEILLFSDANNRYVPATVRAIVRPFADPRVGVVSGRKAIDDGSGRPLDRAEGLYWRYESRIKTWESRAGSVSGVAGEIIAFRREAFLVPERPLMNEDFAQAMLAATAGWRVVYAPEAISLERASATTDDELARRTRLVTGRWQAMAALLPGLAARDPVLAWQVVSHKALRPVVPFALVVALVASALLAVDVAWARAVVGLQAAFYVAAALGWFSERRGRRNRLLYLPYYFCRLNAATLRGSLDFLRGRREHVWTRVRRA